VKDSGENTAVHPC